MIFDCTLNRSSRRNVEEIKVYVKGLIKYLFYFLVKKLTTLSYDCMIRKLLKMRLKKHT